LTWLSDDGANDAPAAKFKVDGKTGCSEMQREVVLNSTTLERPTFFIDVSSDGDWRTRINEHAN
jgi:hypothetical protein